MKRRAPKPPAPSEPAPPLVPGTTELPPEAPRRGNALFQLWEEAERLVPYPWLYLAEATPRPGASARHLDELVRFEFVYRVTDGFIARIQGERGALGPAVLFPGRYHYEFTPIQSRTDLCTPEEAVAILLRDLAKRDAAFWERILHPEPPPGTPPLVFFEEHGWEFLRLQQPFAPGITEPYYQFRKRCAEVEFWVGAENGSVTMRPIPHPPFRPLGT